MNYLAGFVKLGGLAIVALYSYNAGVADAEGHEVFQYVYAGFAALGAAIHLAANLLHAREGSQRKKGVMPWGRRTLSGIASYASSKMRVFKGGVTSGSTQS